LYAGFSLEDGESHGVLEQEQEPEQEQELESILGTVAKQRKILNQFKAPGFSQYVSIVFMIFDSF
jgi:hypothetical protein